MIILTGGAGLIGSNLLKVLNQRGRHEIIVVDNLSQGKKFFNLVDCEYLEYWDKTAFITALEAGHFNRHSIEVIFHQGACSDTTLWDGKYLMDNNFSYSKRLLDFCLGAKIPYIYASSAAVYGKSEIFSEQRQYESPLNVYGYSKLQFDQTVRFISAKSQVVGLRYFNVYGPREGHKAKMASVAFHHYQQLQAQNTVALFGGYAGYEPGEQKRDFIYIDDVIDVNLFFWDHPELSGIYNVGTGKAQSFNDLAKAVIEYFGRGEVEYLPFPETLKGAYQSFTEANISKLRQAGFQQEFKTLAHAIPQYFDWLKKR